MKGGGVGSGARSKVWLRYSHGPDPYLPSVRSITLLLYYAVSIILWLLEIQCQTMVHTTIACKLPWAVYCLAIQLLMPYSGDDEEFLRFV